MNVTYSKFIINLIREIEKELATLNAPNKIKSLDLQLRKNNHISTIISTCQIEGTFVSENIETLLRNGNRLVGNSREIIELRNALELYDSLEIFDPFSEKDLKAAHKILTNKLLPKSGHYRSVNVGVGTPDFVKYIAPDFQNVAPMMKKLFKEINEEIFDDITLSCYAHLMIETVHPFVDGNGRIGRFWQTLFLTKKVNYIFYYLNIEGLIKKNQIKYYETLNRSQKTDNANYFIEFMLKLLIEGIQKYKTDILFLNDPILRLMEFKKHIKNKTFSRKEYIEFLEVLSPATSTRDLALGVSEKILTSTGDRSQTRYEFIVRKKDEIKKS